MPADLVKKIDKQAKLQGSNRSDFIRQAVRKQVDILEMWDRAATAARRDYKGRPITEKEVADLVRAERAKASKIT